MEGIPTDRTLLDEIEQPEPWELWEEIGRPINTPFRHKPGCQGVYPGEFRCLCWPENGVVNIFPNRATRRNWKARGLIDATR